MTDVTRNFKLSADEWDELRRPAPETTDFDRVVEAAISRRGFLSGLIAVGSGATAMGLMSGTSARAQSASRFAFLAIIDLVSVAVGYRLGASALETLRRVKYNVLSHRKGTELEPLGD